MGIAKYFFIILMILITGCHHTPRPRYTTSDFVRIPETGGSYPAVTQSNRLRGELSDFKKCYDVSFYDIYVDVDLPSKSIVGSVKFTAKALTDLDTVQFDLYDNMHIEKIMENDSQRDFYRRENSVFAVLSNHLSGETIHFTVYYSGKPQSAKRPPWDGGFVWSIDKNDRPWAGVACEGDGASLWWPNKDHPSDEPDSVEIRIKIPTGLMAVSNGKLVGVEPADLDPVTSEPIKNIYTWKVNNPINNYNVTLNIGDYTTVIDTLVNQSGIHEIRHYVLSYHQDVAETYFSQAKDVVHFYEKVYGEYPWWKDGYRLVETPYRGMEHQSAIAYGNDFKRSNNYYIYDLVDYIILHETAHEWWGNNITACDGADVWLHESFATYSEVLYIEEKLGRLTSIDYLMNKRKFIQNKLPMVGPRDVNYWGFDDVYWKGAWMLHTLRTVINNDQLFYSILHDFQQEYGKSIVCSEDFIRFTNQKTGTDYQYFFDQYLYNRKPPTLEYQLEDDQLRYRWTGVNEKFVMPLNILVNQKSVTIYPTTSQKVLAFDPHSIVELPVRYYYMALTDLGEKR